MLAQLLSRQLQGGETVELLSDLGGGKTTFVKGLARGLGYTGDVTSPTFTLSQSYPLPSGRELHHYDLYRLTSGGVVGQELAEDMGDPGIITVIEWADIVSHMLPHDRLSIAIETTGDTERTFHFSAGGPVSRRILTAVSKDTAS